MADVSSIKSVNIRPGVSVLSVLRHLNYKPWFALAEFVDNSLQSYLSNRTTLEQLHRHQFKLTVNIDIEPTPPARISIRDNAAGISLKDFPRAFRPAAVPTDRTGLSEFGIGMKSAACWFAPRWLVRTKALSERVERVIQFDIKQIVNDQIEELNVKELPAKTEDHFTEVVLEGIYHPPIRKSLSKIKEHLADIYRIYLRAELLPVLKTPSLVFLWNREVCHGKTEVYARVQA